MEELMQKQKNRERPIQIKFYVSERERDFILKKMAIANTKNQSTYIRKMAVDGYILNVDFTELRELFANVGRIAGSVNQIAKRVNSTNNIYVDDIADLQKRQGEVWQLLKSMQSKLR
jgi:SepF-like predicted cell division protein (DUF552 family)